MKWIVRFLKQGFGRNKNSDSERPANYEDTVRLDISDIKADKSLGAEVAEWMDDHETDDEPTVSDLYNEEYEATIPDLKILDVSSEEVEESNGFDPYDSVDPKEE